MKTINIVFTKSKKSFPILGWAIRLWTWKSFSHVALEVPVGFLEKPMYWQANEGKINYEYHDHFHKEHEVIHKYEVKVPEEIYDVMKKERLKSAGENYGYFQNAGIALVDILKLIKIKISNPWKKGKNCSESIYLNVLKPMFPGLKLDPNTIKPHHVKKVLDEKGYKDVK